MGFWGPLARGRKKTGGNRGEKGQTKEAVTIWSSKIFSRNTCDFAAEK